MNAHRWLSGLVTAASWDSPHLIGVGLIEPSWLTILPPDSADRLKQILDTPYA
jgi:hypothetical protein